VTAGSFSTDGEFAQSGGATNAAAITQPLGTDDYSVEAVIIVPPGSVYSGIIARGRPDGLFTYDLYSLQLSSAGTVNLYRRNDAVWTLLQSAEAGVVANQPYTLGLKVTGADPVNLEVTLNGTVRFTYRDSAAERILTGIPGVINYNTGVRYDRFTVSPATVPPPGNQSPAARIVADPISGTAPLKVTFDGSTSSDPDGTISSYVWDFGDGTNTAGAIVDHSYSAGTFSATLTVTDNDGATASSSITITVNPGFEAAGVLFQDDFSRTTGLGPNWNVQVGSFKTNGSMAVSQGGQNWAALVPALNSNDYTVESMLTLPTGSLYTGVVVRGSPAGSFYQNLYAAQLSSQGTANLYRRNNGVWTLLKGVQAGIIANKPYLLRLKVTGSNPVNLEVSLNGGVLFSYADASSSRLPAGIPGIQDYSSGVLYDRFTVYSAANLSPTAKMTAAPSSGPAPLPVHFDGSGSTDPGGTIVSYAWDFGDGSAGSGQKVDHTYSSNGTYSAVLVVTDNTGATASTRSSIVVGTNSGSRFVYAANSASNNVTMYTIDAATGALTRIGAVAAGGQPYVIATDPKGRFAYAGNFAANTVSIYRINPNSGILTPAGTVNTGIGPYSIVVDPAGQFVYVANENSSTDVWVYRIDPASGALAFVGTTSAGISPISIAIDPFGAFVYVANTSSHNVSMYTVNGSTGMLTRLGEVAAGTGANSVVVHPSGRFAYVSNYNSNDVSIFALDRNTGRLTKKGTIAAGRQAFSMAVDPSGKFAYVANSASNNVSMYRIDGSTGLLTSLGAVAGGSGPRSITVDLSGKFAYLANLNSNDISVYSIHPTTGVLSLQGRYPAGITTHSVATAGAVK
jgi:6-phosphogluconolactonase (cycloisomerase 2 family)/chitodextrinase